MGLAFGKTSVLGSQMEATVEFDIYWSRIRQLEGRTLRTDARGLRFAVVAVTDTFIRVKPQSSGRERSPIKRSRFEEAFDLGLFTVTIAPGELQQAMPSTRDSSYIATIIHAAVNGGRGK